MDPSKMGLSEDEYLQRKKDAASTYKVKRAAGDGTFNISSSARSQQIMAKGTAEKLRDGRRAEIKEKIFRLNIVRWSVLIAGVASLGFIMYEVMLPISQLHWKRAERLRRRHEEVFKPAMEKMLRERETLGPESPIVRNMLNTDHVLPRSPSSV